MTKARARERAKAKASQKIKKREANADQPDQNIPAGKFDPRVNSISSPGTSAAGASSGARRGAARSR